MRAGVGFTEDWGWHGSLPWFLPSDPFQRLVFPLSSVNTLCSLNEVRGEMTKTQRSLSLLPAELLASRGLSASFLQTYSRALFLSIANTELWKYSLKCLWNSWRWKGLFSSPSGRDHAARTAPESTTELCAERLLSRPECHRVSQPSVLPRSFKRLWSLIPKE